MATHKPINILEAFAAAPPPLDYVLPNMVAGTVGALVSPGGAGKSMLALQLAAQIAGGPDLLEVGELPTGPVIYLPAEDPPTAIHHRLHALGAHLSADRPATANPRDLVFRRVLDFNFLPRFLPFSVLTNFFGNILEAFLVPLKECLPVLFF